MSRPASGQPAAGASRRDRALGITERFEFFGAPGEQLAGSMHAPMTAPSAALLICPSICNDYIRNYRNEILMARALAARGILTARFDYRGTGNSDGDAMDVSFAGMCDDAQKAASWLRAGADGLAGAVMGTRFGALVAASVADELAAQAIVWVDPTIDGSRFFREAWRARLAREAKAGTDAAQTTLHDTLERAHAVDVLGHSVGEALVRTVEGRTLLGELTAPACQVLWVQLGGKAELPPPARVAVSALTDLGFAVETRQVGDREPWWFLADDETPARDHLPIIESWLTDRLSVAGPASR